MKTWWKFGRCGVPFAARQDDTSIGGAAFFAARQDDTLGEGELNYPPEVDAASAFHDKVDEFVFDDDHFYELLAFERFLYFFIVEGGDADDFVIGIVSDGEAGAHFAVELDDDFYLVFLGEDGIELGPRMSEKGVGVFAESGPEFRGEIRGERVEQEYKVSLHFRSEGYRSSGVSGEKFLFDHAGVEEFHHGRNRCIEVPASLEIAGDAMNGLVQFSEYFSGIGGKRGGFVRARIARGDDGGGFMDKAIEA